MKLRSCLFFLLLLCLPFSSVAAKTPSGDTDGNGRADANDAALVLRHVVSLTELSDDALSRADCDDSGTVDAVDAACILRRVVGIAAEPSEPLPLSGKVVILDAGHGQNPVTGSYLGGITAREDGTYYYEADIVLDITLRAKEKLEADGATVVLTRSDPDMVGNYVRMALLHQHCLSRLAAQTEDPKLLSEYDRLFAVMEQVKQEYVPRTDSNGTTATVYFDTPYDYGMERVIHPDLLRLFLWETDPLFDDTIFLSVHTNASDTDSSRRGIVVYCLDNTFNATYCSSYREERNLLLGETMLACIDAASALDSLRDRVSINDYFMLREHNLPAALLELGYHSNAEDRAILESETGRDALAKGIRNGVLAYFAEADA